MEQIQILEAKVKALEELVAIQNEIITALKNKPAQIQYVPYQQPYWLYQYPYWTYGAGGAINGSGNYSIQGSTSNINKQLNLAQGGQGQLCSTQGSLVLAK